MQAPLKFYSIKCILYKYMQKLPLQLSKGFFMGNKKDNLNCLSNRSGVKDRKWGKQHNLITSLIAMLVLIGVIAVVSIAYNFLGGFYYCRVVSFDKVLGEEQTVTVNGVGAFVCATNFSGSLVVGADVKQVINVVIDDIDEPVYLRAKATVNGFEGGTMIMGYSNWAYKEDGYIYFNQSVNAFEKIGVCNMIRLNMQMELKSSNNYIVIFVIESSATPW